MTPLWLLGGDEGPPSPRRRCSHRCPKYRRAERQRPHDHPPPAAGGTSAATASSTSSAARMGCPPRWRPSSTTRTGRPASHCSTTPTGPRPTSWPRPACASETPGAVRARCRHQDRQLPPPVGHPDGDHGARHRDSAPARARSWSARRAATRSSWPRRAARRCCGCPRARCELFSGGLPGGRRLTLGTPTHQNESGGKAGRSRWRGPPADGARLGHEPRRPSARGRRGQVQGRPAPGHPPGASPRSATARGNKRRPPAQDIVRGRKRGEGRAAGNEPKLEEGPVRRRASPDAMVDGVHAEPRPSAGGPASASARPCRRTRSGAWRSRASRRPPGSPPGRAAPRPRAAAAAPCRPPWPRSCRSPAERTSSRPGRGISMASPWSPSGWPTGGGSCRS